MDRPPNSAEEVTESVNLGDQGLPASDPSKSVRSESHAPAEPNKAFLRISKDMARVLERFTAPKAPIDMIRRHVTCTISLLQGSAYDSWKLLLRSPRLLDPIPWEFFV